MLGNLWRKLSASFPIPRHPLRRAAARRRCRRVRPCPECLEERTVLATVNVTSTADVTNYNPATVTVAAVLGQNNVTLRDAINAANNTGGSNTLVLQNTTYTFNTPDNFWYGPDALPAINSTITIDGNGAILQRDPGLAPTTAGALRFFFVGGGLSGLNQATLTLNNLTLQNGLAKGGDSFEGGGALGAGPPAQGPPAKDAARGRSFWRGSPGQAGCRGCAVCHLRQLRRVQFWDAS